MNNRKQTASETKTFQPINRSNGHYHIQAGGMLSEPKMFVDSHFDWSKRRAFFLSQVFSCALNDDCPPAGKGNMYIHGYLFLTSQTGVFRMAMTLTGSYSSSYIYRICSQSFS